MQTADARALAHRVHIGQRTRHGDLLTEHLERVAAAVPPDAMTVAFLHDVLEHSDLRVADLEGLGLTDDEVSAVLLLTQDADESFEAHSLRIAFAAGTAGRLARIVKLADLDDHLNSRRVAMAPPYGWARQHIMACSARQDVAIQEAA
jgi:(p)ppGpp synthase/HD superfamily hydrolase